MKLRPFLTLFRHSWPLSTKQMIKSLIIYQNYKNSTNKKLRIPKRITKNVDCFPVPVTRNLATQPQQVPVNQVATKKTRKKKKIMFDVSNFNS